MVSSSVSVVIPTIPPRADMLTRALGSVAQQTITPHAIHVSYDYQRFGAATNRGIALRHSTTMWTAFLDDDDEFRPNHLEVLLGAASSHVDVVYTGCLVFDGAGNEIPLQEEWGRFGKPFDPVLLRQKSYLPITSLVRTSLAQEAGFWPRAEANDSKHEDHTFYMNMLDLGARFLHIPIQTWFWHHHGKNTSGKADRW